MTTRCAASNRAISILVLTLLGTAGCTGRTYTLYHFESSAPPFFMFAAGTRVSIEGAGQGAAQGELIEVREDGFLILSEETAKLTLVPYAWMLSLDFDNDVGANRSVDGPSADIPPLKEDQIRQRAIARFSRYPFGLDEGRLRRLLEALGQSELVVIGS